VDAGFFRPGVICFVLEDLGGALFKTRGDRVDGDCRGDGDARTLVGVVLPPRLVCPCLAPRGVLFPLTLGDTGSGLGIRLRCEQPIHLRADC
jgi:hypothetical protein